MSDSRISPVTSSTVNVVAAQHIVEIGTRLETNHRQTVVDERLGVREPGELATRLTRFGTVPHVANARETAACKLGRRHAGDVAVGDEIANRLTGPPQRMIRPPTSAPSFR